MPVKKKVATKSSAQGAGQRQAERRLAAYAAEMKSRGDWARKILRAQDQNTQNAVQDMIDAISKMADEDREARVTLNNGEVVTLRADDEIFEDGWLWVALRLCNVAYEWDIRVANFKPVRKIKKAGVR